MSIYQELKKIVLFKTKQKITEKFKVGE